MEERQTEVLYAIAEALRRAISWKGGKQKCYML